MNIFKTIDKGKLFKSFMISLGGASIAFITSFISGGGFGLAGPIVTALGAFAVNAIKEAVEAYKAKPTE